MSISKDGDRSIDTRGTENGIERSTSMKRPERQQLRQQIRFPPDGDESLVALMQRTDARDTFCFFTPKAL